LQRRQLSRLGARKTASPPRLRIDPDGDYYRLTHEQPSGDSICRSLPSACSSRRAPRVPHSGGSPRKKRSPFTTRWFRWLEAGAPADAGKVPTIDSLNFTASALLDGARERSSSLSARSILTERIAT